MRSMLVRGLVVLVLATTSTGCARMIRPATDRIVVAPVTASFRERRESFVSLRPEGLDMTHVIHYDRLFGRHERWVNSLTLTNGTLIYTPDVLLTGIDPDSATARSIERYDRFRRRANRRLWIARGFGIAFLGSLVSLVAVHDTNARIALGATSGGMLLGFGATRFAFRVANRRRNEAEYQAYLTYDGDLARHLHLCVGDDGETVSECR